MINRKIITIFFLITILLGFSLSVGFSKEIPINNTSIQETINNADANDVILLKNGKYVESNIIVNNNLSIVGNNDKSDVIIDGNNSGSIFTITNNATVYFINITFINGNSFEFGGAIKNIASNVYIDNCVFINNSAILNGGALDNSGNENESGYMFVNNSKFINNYAGRDGGAITTMFGTTDIYNSYFTLNYADRDGGAIRGGIYSDTNVFSSIICNNVGNEWGGAFYMYPGNGQVRNSIISNNSAGSIGGGFFIAGSFIITGSIISNNSAGIIGGAIYITEEISSTNLIFNNNLFYDNKAINGSNIYIYSTSSKTINFNANDWGNITNINEIIEGNPNYDLSRFYPSTFKPFYGEVSLNVSNFTMYYRNGSQYIVSLNDYKGNPIVNASITMIINGNTVNRITNKDGLVLVTINLNPGTYEIITFFNESDITNIGLVTVLPTIHVENLTKFFKNDSQYYILVLDNNGNPINGINVSVNINGIFYNKTTNASGIAKLSINLNPGEYIATAIHPITGLMMTSIVIVKPTLIGENLIKNFNEKGSYNIKVLNDVGISLAGEIVNININGVFYERISDANGIAILNINLNPGSYIATAMWNGYSTSNIITVNG